MVGVLLIQLVVLLLPYGLLLWREFSLPIRLIFVTMLEIIVAACMILAILILEIPPGGAIYFIEFIAELIVCGNLLVAVVIAICRRI